MARKKISIVIPVYNEEVNIQNSLQVISKEAASLGLDYELVCIDDGSSDKTWEILEDCARSYPEMNLRCFSFSRNFGKEAAIKAGIDQADGDALILMDADLQHPPSKIKEMVRLWQEEGYNIVHCKKSLRGKENIFYRAAAGIFYFFFNRLTGGDFQGSSDFRLLDRVVADTYRRITERNAFFRGLIDYFGFKKAEIPFEVAEREGDESKWTLKALIDLSIKAVTSFSRLPLHIVTVMGLVFFIFAVGLSLQTLYNFIFGEAASGFTTVILLLLIIGSIIMFSLGIIGEYLAKIYEEVKARPMYIIERKTESEGAAKT